MSRKEGEICELEVDCGKSFCCCSGQGDGDMISFWGPGLRTGVGGDIFWSGVGSGF